MKALSHRFLFGILFGAVLAALFVLPGAHAWAAGWDDVEAAWAAKRRGQNAEAIKLVTRGINSGKLKGIRLARAYVTLGRAYQAMDRLRAAGTEYTRAIKLVDKTIRLGRLSGKDLAYAYNTRGLAHQKMGRLEKAIADYNVALKVLPGFHKFLLNRANAYSLLGRYGLAIVDYSVALEAQPGSFNLYYSRAAAQVWQGNYEQAIADYEQALKISPKDSFRWGVFIGRGNAYFMKGDFGQAIADYEKSLALNPRYKAVKKRIAKARKAIKHSAQPGYESDSDLWASVKSERSSQK